LTRTLQARIFFLLESCLSAIEKSDLKHIENIQTLSELLGTLCNSLSAELIINVKPQHTCISITPKNCTQLVAMQAT